MKKKASGEAKKIWINIFRLRGVFEVNQSWLQFTSLEIKFVISKILNEILTSQLNQK